MTTITRYPTRSLAIWPKLKELRRQLNQEAWAVQDAGGVVAASQTCCHALLAGLGPFARRLYGPYFSKAMRTPDILVEYHQVADGRGYPRGEMCSSMHHHVGELLLGLTTINPWNGAPSPVDLVFEMEFCSSVAKTAQLAGEVLGVPHFVLDVPQGGGESAVQYVATRMQDAVDFLVRVTGKEYQDEWLIEAVENWWERGALIARICRANQAVPATVDHHLVQQLVVPSIVAGHRREVVEFYEELLAEVEERVRDGISVRGVETARLSHEGEPMYYAEDFVADLVGRYGAVIVGGFVGFTQGLWEITPDGRWTPVPSFRDLGVTLRNRDDALHFLARGYALNAPIFHCVRLDEKSGEYLNRARDWRCDGSIIHLDIGCRYQAAGMLEAKLVLEQAGIPAVTYQASCGDSRDFSPQQVGDALESFMERLGLRPIG